jgi:NADH-quinone oxidoreductase subunit A
MEYEMGLLGMVSLNPGVAAGYLPILLFLGVAIGLSSLFVFAPMAISRLTGTHKPTPEKLTEYECGFPAFEGSRAQFDVRFYLVAILFIIFDLEAAFLFPWAVSLRETGWAGWGAMMIFLVELGLGLVYAWKKGALEWE